MNFMDQCVGEPMARKSREQSQAETRASMLKAAGELFARHGYSNTSIDRIAERAGFSKGAFYSNFRTKDEIFLEVLDAYGESILGSLLQAVDAAVDVQGAIAAVAAWATLRSRQGNWSLLILEQAHQRGKRAGAARSPEALFRSHWRQLGERLLRHTTRKDLDPEHLGAVVFELTHAPAMSIVSEPTAGDLVAMTLHGLLTPAG